MAKKSRKSEEKKEGEGSSSLFDKAVALINEEYGRNVVERLSELKDRPIVGYSTGSLALDYVISPRTGGMEAGRVIELWGDYSTGKTTLALGLCANVIANGRKAVFVDAENSFRWDMAQNIITNLAELHLIDKIPARESANVARQLIQTGEVGILVIDSVAAWKPLPETKKDGEDTDFTKDKIGAQSLFLSQTLPILSHICRQHGTILVLLNQARENIGAYQGGLKPFGGKAEEHQNNVRLKLSGRASYTSARILDPESEEIIGQWVTVNCDKNKLDRPFKEVKIPLILGYGVNPYMELAELAVMCGVVEAPSGRYRLAGSDQQLAHGANAFVALLHENHELFKSLRVKTIEALGIEYAPGRIVVNPFIREEEAVSE